LYGKHCIVEVLIAAARATQRNFTITCHRSGNCDGGKHGGDQEGSFEKSVHDNTSCSC